MKAHRRTSGAAVAIIIAVVVLLIGAAAFVFMNFMNKPQKESLSQVPLDAPQEDVPMVAEIPAEAVSKIGFTLAIPQARVRELVGNAVPKTMASGGPMKKEITQFLQDEWFDFNFQRGDVGLKFHDNVVSFSVPIQGSVTAGGTVGIGPLERQIQKTVDIAGTVSGDIKLAVSKDYSVKASPTVHFNCQQAQVDFGPFPPISLCDPISHVFDEKAPPIAQNAANQAVQKLGLKKKIEDAWKQMFIVKEAVDSPPTWVEVVPQNLVMKPLNLSSDPLQLSFGADAKTFVVVQKTPPVVAAKPLPKLVFDPKLTNEVDINLPIAAPVDSLSNRLDKELKGKQIPVGDQGVVTINGVKVGTKGDKVICALDINAVAPKAGNAGVAGTVWLGGKLNYDPATSVIKIVDLDWDAQTKSAPVVQNAAWLMHDEVLNAVREKASFDAAPVIAQAKDQANAILKDKLSEIKGPVAIDVKVDSIKLEEMRVQNSRAYAFFSARGQAGGILR